MIGLGSDENEIFTLVIIVLDLWLRSRVLKLWQKKKSCAMCVSFLHCSHLLKTPSVPLFRPHYTPYHHHHHHHHHHHPCPPPPHPPPRPPHPHPHPHPPLP